MAGRNLCDQHVCLRVRGPLLDAVDHVMDAFDHFTTLIRRQRPFGNVDFGDRHVVLLSYLPRGTKTWPLTPNPPSAVSKICTKSRRVESFGCFIARRMTSVMPLIIAAFCSAVRTPAGTWTSTRGEPMVVASSASARTLDTAVNAPATVAVIRTCLRLKPPALP